MFSGARGPGLALANITVSIRPESARRVGEVQRPSRVPGSPATEFVTLKANAINQKQAMA
jgi:esterase/lipase superfamily enzyme